MSEDPRISNWKYNHLFESTSHEESSAPVNEEDINDEQGHLHSVIGSFSFYHITTELIWRKLERNFNLIPPSHQHILENPRGDTMSFKERIRKLRAAAIFNTQFLRLILESSAAFTSGKIPSLSEFLHYKSRTGISPTRNPASDFNTEKVQATLRQFVREWSIDGKKERDKCYDPFFEVLQIYLPINDETRFKYNVCCPGSGLGRLPFELCVKGYKAVANEFSYFMLICSNFILNKTVRENQFLIYPYIHQVANIRDSCKQLTPVTFPDVNPSIIPSESDFSCIAGDFLNLAYENPNYWDAVCTCFFIDTANNVIEYMEAIYNSLKPGGYWFNLGPLLYHYSDVPGEISLELTLDQIFSSLEHIGFVLLTEKTVKTRYGSNGKGITMMQTVFKCSFFVALKSK